MTTDKVTPRNSSLRTGRGERVTTLYQLDPGFYKKIISRSTSISSSSCYSIYHKPGNVPFNWEMQPGEPTVVPKVDNIVPRVTLPRAFRGFGRPRPFIHSSGPKAYSLKKINIMKNIKNIRTRLPPAVCSLSMPRPNISAAEAKAYFHQSINKVKKIKSIQPRLRQAVRSLSMPTTNVSPRPNISPADAKPHFSQNYFKKVKKSKSLPPGQEMTDESPNNIHLETAESDGFEFPKLSSAVDKNIHLAKDESHDFEFTICNAGHFLPLHTSHSTWSTAPLLLPTPPPSSASSSITRTVKSNKLLHSWRLPLVLRKWRKTKLVKGT